MKWYFSNISLNIPSKRHTCLHINLLTLNKRDVVEHLKVAVYDERSTVANKGILGHQKLSILKHKLCYNPQSSQLFYQTCRNLSSSSLALAATEEASVGFFTSLIEGISKSKPTLLIGDGFCWFHDVTGLNWYASILFTTLVMRFFLMGQAHITSRKTAAKRRILYQNLEKDFIPELKKALAAKIKQENLDEVTARKKWNIAIKRVMDYNFMKYNCIARKLYLPFVIQIPLWVCTSMALRNMSTLQHISENSYGQQVIEAKFRFLQLSTEGFAWIPNLTLPDHSLIVPCIVGMSFLVNNEVMLNRYKKDFIDKGATEKFIAPKTADLEAEKQTSPYYVPGKEKKSSPKDILDNIILESTFDKLKRYFRGQVYQGKYLKPEYISNFFRLFSILMIPMAALAPSAVACYWAASGLSALAVNLTLLSPKVQNFVKIPMLPEQSDTPYQDVLNNMKARTRRSLSKLKLIKEDK